MPAGKVHVPSSGVKLSPYDRRASRSIEVDTQLPIRNIDYTVIFARQMAEMRSFYGTTPGFPLHRELGAKWIEYRVACNLLALRERSALFNDPLPPVGVHCLQLALRVAPSEVASCAAVLAERGVTILAGPTDQAFGHRTLFFRDPDGNALEIYAQM